MSRYVYRQPLNCSFPHGTSQDFQSSQNQKTRGNKLLEVHKCPYHHLHGEIQIRLSLFLCTFHTANPEYV